MDIKKFDDFPREDLNVTVVELFYELNKTTKSIHTPELHLVMEVENKGGRDSVSICRDVVTAYETNKIGYSLMYVDPVTFDYEVFLLVSLQSNEEIKKILESIPNVKSTRFYKPRYLDVFYRNNKKEVYHVENSDRIYIREARERLKKLMFGV